MAASEEKKETRRRSERVVPNMDKGASRVSRAAGNIQFQQNQDSRLEARSNAPASRQGSARTSRASVPKEPASTRSRAGTSQGSKKSSGGPSRSVSSPSRSASAPAPSSSPRDTGVVRWVYNRWNSLEAHHQQRIFGVLLLALSLLLFGSLTSFRTTPVLSGINAFFITFFGWSAYLLALGLVAFAMVHLIEGIRNQRILRWSTVIGLVCIWLLLLVESRLIMGHLAVGALAEFLVIPLLGWPAAIGHVVTLGLLIIAIVFTFRITLGHVMLVVAFVQRIASDRNIAPHEQEEEEDLPAQGQRPQFSRYGGTPSQPARPVRRNVSRAARQPVEEEYEDDMIEDDDEGTIEFDPAWDEDDDPRNDINIHKQHIGNVQRGLREPEPLDLTENSRAVRGANQQSLPFEEPAPPSPGPQRQRKLVVKGSQASELDMEPLVPNPRLTGIAPTRSRNTKNANVQPELSSGWTLPNTTLLNNPDNVKLQMLGDDTATLARTIQETLRSFRVEAEVRAEDISIGPTVIRFGIRPTGKPELMLDEKSGKMVPVRDGAGNIVYETRTRVSRIMALQNDLALVLEAKTIRMEAPVPGRPYVGVEIPNKNSRLVTLREVLESKEYQAAKAKSKLTVALGKDVAGQVRVGDLARMPHVLIAGATGAGKSVMINTIIASILFQATPDDVRLLMVDPKMVELNLYNGIPHLLSPVVTEVEKVVPLLKNAINEMERRYRLFSQLNVRNLDGYRKLRLEKIGKGDTSLNNLPAIVIIIDELADLMMAAPEEVEGMICRLAQLARATGIHLVVATQRPSVDVITGLIKANIPTRISFMVSSAVDSRTIIDMGGAERLLGRGDMLYLPADAGRPERVQGSFLADEEAESIVGYWKQQIIEHAIAIGEMQPEEIEDPESLVATVPATEPGWEIKEAQSDEYELDDDLLDRAEEIVREYGRASISLLQRRLRVGYSRAARLIDLLEEHGIIGQFEANGKAREILDNNNGYERPDPNSRTIIDEANDIMEEERARNEFLRKQAQSTRQAQRQKQNDYEDG